MGKKAIKKIKIASFVFYIQLFQFSLPEGDKSDIVSSDNM